eukprot:SAG11_NODE_623_length_8115_cov_51.423278_5_plen_145_part_00
MVSAGSQGMNRGDRACAPNCAFSCRVPLSASERSPTQECASRHAAGERPSEASITSTFGAPARSEVTCKRGGQARSREALQRSTACGRSGTHALHPVAIVLKGDDTPCAGCVEARRVPTAKLEDAEFAEVVLVQILCEVAESHQ